MRGTGSPGGRPAASWVPLAALLLLLVLLGLLPGGGATRTVKLPVTPDLVAIARRHLLQAACTGGNWGPSYNESCIYDDARGDKAGCTSSDIKNVTAFLIVSDRRAKNGTQLPLISKGCCFDNTTTCYLCEPGETVEGLLSLSFRVTAGTRYNLGLWVAEAGAKECPGIGPGSLAGCPGNRCTKNTWPPVAPFYIDDKAVPSIDNCCGELNQGFYSNITVPSYRVTCEGNVSTTSTEVSCVNSAEPLDWCMAWGNPGGTNPQCEQGPTGGFMMTGPDQSSKCQCEIARLGGVEVFVPTCGDLNLNPDVATPFVCPPPPNYVRKPNIENYDKPSIPNCCTFVPTCGWPVEAQSDTRWACPPDTLFNASAVNATNPSNTTCCLPTCARRDVNTPGAWTCSPPLAYASSPASITPPSNGTCCLPTCGQVDVNSPGNWTCTWPFVYNASAAGLAPPSNDTCCFFVPICAQQAPSLPYSLDWVCPPRSERLLDQADTPTDARYFNDTCCASNAPIPAQVNLTASGDARVCQVGQELSYTMTVLSYGAGNASSVNLTNTYNDPGLTFVSASCPGAAGACTFTPPPDASTSSGLVVCELGRMNPVRAITCTFTVSLDLALPALYFVDGVIDVLEDDGFPIDPPLPDMAASLQLSADVANCTADGLLLQQDGDVCTCVLPEVALSVPDGVCTDKVGAPVTYTLSVSSVGNGTAPFVALTSLVYPQGLALSSAAATCLRPDGTVVSGGAAPALGCKVTLKPDDLTSFNVTCLLGPMPAGSVIACTFSPVASPVPVNYTDYVFTVESSLALWDSYPSTRRDAGPDSFGNFDTTLSKCPPYKRYNATTCTCDILQCKPCATANPTVYFTTGSQAVPSNSLWRVQNFALGNLSQRAEFLCKIEGMKNLEPNCDTGDIAVLWNGGILVLDTLGGLGYLAPEKLPTPSTPPTTNTVAATQKCKLAPLYEFSGRSFTGLAHGFVSNEFMFSTGGGDVRNIYLEASKTLNVSEGSAVPWVVPCNPRNRLTNNTGGTDLTAGPDGNIYRWAAMQVPADRSQWMNYTGTRLFYDRCPTCAEGGIVDWQYVSENATNQNNAIYYGKAPLANAGAFCTDTTVVGTAFIVGGTGSAGFLEFGYSGGTAWTGLARKSFLATTLPSPLRYAKLVGRATPSNAVTNAMRINGAAVAPVCDQTLVVVNPTG